MFFREVINEDLGCASYFIADGGYAAVVDPKWEIEAYLELASQNGFTITSILETHNHADHISGRGRLVEATGAKIYISEHAGVQYDHQALSDGDVVHIGDVQIRAMATPGHRPEHLSFLVTDTTRSPEPWLILTGDSLFVGDLARPDLAVEAEEGAKKLFGSLRQFLELEDFVGVKPAHIGGSLCGGPGMSRNPDSTIGFERRYNEYLLIHDEASFVETLIGELSPQPPNFEQIVELNRGPLLNKAATLEPLLPQRVRELVESGAVVLDGRDQREFDAAHIAGSINVTMNQAGVGTRAAWMVDPQADIITIADGEEKARHMWRMLEAVGFRNVRGYLSGGISAWRASQFAVDTTPAMDVPGLAERLRLDEVVLLDVRDESEWAAGHVKGSINLPYQCLRDGVPDQVRNVDKPLAVACSGGIRSALAASQLRRHGVHHIQHVADGGVPGLSESGIELVAEE